MSARSRKFQVGFCFCILAISLFVTIGCKPVLQSIYPFTTSCGTDNEISVKDRLAADQVAMEFVQDTLGPKPETAYAAFTDETKTNVSFEQFAALVKQTIQPMAPFKDLHVAHTYLAKVTGGTQAQRVVCGNLASPESWVAVTAKRGPAQAHVIVEAQTLNNTWVFVIWLMPEQGSWRVEYLQATISAMVGKTAEDLWHLADSEEQKNHNLNAYILYATAMQLSARGANFQLGIQPEIEKEFKNLHPPSNVQPPPPFIWQFGQSTFKVLNVGPIGIGGKIYLQIDHELEPWATDKDADRKNHELISAFAGAYPEYKDAFSGLVVRAHERGGTRGFTTVSENEPAAK
jgi:hypothetical protein